MQGIDPCTSHMQSERSTIWATSPADISETMRRHETGKLQSCLDAVVVSVCGPQAIAVVREISVFLESTVLLENRKGQGHLAQLQASVCGVNDDLCPWGKLAQQFVVAWAREKKREKTHKSATENTETERDRKWTRHTDRPTDKEMQRNREIQRDREWPMDRFTVWLISQ